MLDACMPGPTLLRVVAMPEASGNGRILVSVGIATYCRPSALEELLGVLGQRSAELPVSYVVQVIVVDNAPDASARDVGLGHEWGLPVRYAHEPIPGIAAARRRLMAEADDQRLLVFIDDDESPLPGWLPALVGMWERTGAAGVAGRVHSVLPASTEPWVRAFAIFDRAHPPAGQQMPAAATNNLLLDLEQVRSMGVEFDLRVGLGGGEDTLFTRQLVERGGVIVSCPASVVRDDVEPERTTREFTLRRARFHGTTQATVDLLMARNRWQDVASRTRSTAKGVTWFAVGVLQGLRSIFSRSLRDRAWSARRIQRGIGLVHAAWGSPGQEYARSATSRGAALHDDSL